jgi:LemA protein
MNRSQIVVWAALAVLLFWAVGAYNRLVGLRSALVTSFAMVDAQFRHRHGLLLRLADVLEPLAGADTQPLEAFRAACAQAEAACSRARLRPVAIGLVTSLRMAEDILAEARRRLPAEPAAADDELGALMSELVASDSTYAFARRQFNEHVDTYNRAVHQFPTWMLAGLFRFRTAGTL